MHLLFITPPSLQTHCPYPATPTLLGALKEIQKNLASTHPLQAWSASQADLSIEFFLGVFSRKRLLAWAAERGPVQTRAARAVMERSAGMVDDVIAFLQGKRDDLAARIASRAWLPEGPRFLELHHHAEIFETLSTLDQAKHLSSLFLNDLSDAIAVAVDARFGYARYAEKLAASMPSFTPLARELAKKPTPLIEWLEALTRTTFNKHKPDAVAITVPFPGCVFSTFVIARTLKRLSPRTHVLVGGGTPNTEWRSLDDPRVFEWIDFIGIDDGARPLCSMLELISRAKSVDQLKRTFHLDPTRTRVVFTDSQADHDFPLGAMGTPDYSGLPLDDYVGVLEILNPVQRLWTDGRWLKLTLALGCYWKKCSFCDTSLPYIRDYAPDRAVHLVDKMEAMLAQTRWARGWNGFHFTDEAAPPALLTAMAREIIKRGMKIQWWGNVRFEKSFTPEVAGLLAASGCIALTGGLEVASDRLLAMMQKGVTLAQVARTTKALSDAGIWVHAYLMYGFPTQTTQETVDSLEWVRQLFDAGCLRSAFWHRLSVTAHSPMGLHPERYHVRILRRVFPKGRRFAENDLPFEESIPARKQAPHDQLGEGLKAALHAYKHREGFGVPVHRWFPIRAPRTRVEPKAVRNALRQRPVPSTTTAMSL